MKIKSIISMGVAMAGLVALVNFHLPLFMLAFVVAAMLNSDTRSPVAGMAVVKGMNFTRGRLGDIGFRQQVVKDGNGYRRRTVAFQIPTSVSNPNTPGQVRQRTRFRMVQSLASALARKSILYNFYQATGISGYNAFIRDNISGAVIGNDGGDVYLDFRKLVVTKGDFAKKVKAYKSDLKTDDCHCAKKLAWNYDWTCDPQGTYALNLIGIKIDAEGAVEDIVCVQPRTPMSACMADVELPSCDCCKTYWYAYFIDPFSGYYSSANYIGTCECPEVEFTDDCYTCQLPEQTLTVTLPPEECPIGCGDANVDTGAIIYTGESKVDANQALGGGVIFGACPVYDWQVVVSETGDALTIDFLNTDEVANISIMDQAGNELYTGTDNHIELTSIATLPTSLTALVISTDARCNKELTFALESTTMEPAGNPPKLDVLAPQDGDTVPSDGTAEFAAIANDVEDGDLKESIIWTSDVDGVITADANGQYTLSPGLHTLTVSVTDSDGNTVTKEIKVTAQ